MEKIEAEIREKSGYFWQFMKEKADLYAWFKAGKLNSREYTWLKEELRDSYKDKILGKR